MLLERFGKAHEGPHDLVRNADNDLVEVFFLGPTGRTIESERAYYLDLWSRLVVRPEWVDRVDRIVDRAMVANRARYEVAGSNAGKTPWWAVAIIHMMEGSGDFGTHLHNGDPLTGVTVNVPANRPPSGKPPFTWEESAADALRFDGVDKVDDWSVESAALVFERFNGFGYRSRGIVSPYLAAQTTLWTRGKFVRDGVFDPNAGSSQIGALAYLRRMVDRGIVSFGNEGGAAPAARAATWFEFLRGDDGQPVVAAHAGGTCVDLMHTATVAELVAFLTKHQGAKTFLVAPSGKPIPVPAPHAQDRRARTVAVARQEASKGRSHAPGNEVDRLVLDPIRPALVRLGHLGASQTDSFWDWCGAWVTYVLRQCGYAIPDVPTVRGRPFWASVALVETWVAWAQDRGAWRAGLSGAIQAGDVVVFDWDGDRVSNHIGIVLDPPTANKNMVTAEGNRGNREVITSRARDVVLGTIDTAKLV